MKNKRLFYWFAVLPIVIVLILFAWFFTVIFEGEKPSLSVEPLSEFLAKKETFRLRAGDEQRGLKKLKVAVRQGGREIVILEKKFPFEGLFNRRGTHEHGDQFQIDPKGLNLAQGRVELLVTVWDYSRRGGGDGNFTLLQHNMVVDTIPPSIRSVSRMHNVNVGGVGLVVYQASSDTTESGVYVDELFFPGYPAGEKKEGGYHVCYFGIPYNVGAQPSIRLWARDRAGNQSTSTFYYHLRKKNFRRDKINISDRFLNRVLPYFSSYPFDPGESDIGKYLKINRDLRKKNNDRYHDFMSKSSPKKLWNGTWIRLKNSAPMASFADRRSYFYKGEKVDEQTHLGVDLASLANSPVEAANGGRVVFADRNGIYGLTVVLDHGQGLFSIYGHLSKFNVKTGQDVRKGDIIGFTGQTGLAGGDHLHFGVMVSGLFVNPIEWWDSHWIADNILKKLALLQ